MKTMRFLVNPAGKPVTRSKRKPRKRAAAKRKPRAPGWFGGRGNRLPVTGKTRRRRGAQLRKRRKTAAASLATSPATTPTSKRGTNMATRKRSRAKTARRNAPKRRRRTTRRNPPVVALANPPRRRRSRRNPPSRANIMAFAQNAAVGAVQVVAGKIAVRKVRSLAGQRAGTMLGSLVEAGSAIALGLAVSHFDAKAGERVAIGGLTAPVETLIQQAGIPHVSDALGDDGFLLGDATGVELVSAYPDDQVAGYVSGGDTTVGGYAPGLAIAQ